MLSEEMTTAISTVLNKQEIIEKIFSMITSYPPAVYLTNFSIRHSWVLLVSS